MANAMPLKSLGGKKPPAPKANNLGKWLHPKKAK